jgi:aspartate carbamoyltransferase regulatory subunit
MSDSARETKLSRFVDFNVPDRPDECENSNCIKKPTHGVRFKQPKETVYYCEYHAKEANNRYPKAKSIFTITP